MCIKGGLGGGLPWQGSPRGGDSAGEGSTGSREGRARATGRGTAIS